MCFRLPAEGFWEYTGVTNLTINLMLTSAIQALDRAPTPPR